ncbi:Daunorubicin/doxorubicin resistance ATP-binding protein DrrA [Candidatus Promineifilum breve]|uniref:Daunorubicin/doxorubicin resistance ATP-binding protein DrrA n=1 Tax=Candidatus Promineifilum breve TaxID=1806508 RepID=A0A170PEA0_9CHLR|nr:ATP-binding cassette domain-containing protein [Candidatus Promineifilum breve]CUS02457.2 Daunorubicin/doxorubicin resistance ATP-binding protein DrrA [Candidatus Promineifilum breve]
MTTGHIAVQNLVKRYPGNVVAVDDITLSVDEGLIFGFLGPNGAGKSTTIKILTTFALPTSGRATVGGYDVVTEADKVRRIAGVALQDIGLDPLMKPYELLMLQIRMFGATSAQARARATELLDLVGLSEVTDRRVGTYSGGMRRRLDLALALAHEPRVLFLDEPTTGLDPASRRDVWEEVRRLNRQLGMTIFLTTQYLEEADELANIVAIIDKGRIAVQGTPSKLKSELGNESINLAFEERQTAELAQKRLAELSPRVQIDRDIVRLYMDNAAEAIPGVINLLREDQIAPLSLTLTQPTLDDVFLRVTGQRLKDDSPEMAPTPANGNGHKRNR